jgi:hypothetical protein
MTTLSSLIALAESDAPPCKDAVNMLGADQLALMIATAAAQAVGATVNAAEAAKVLQKPRSTTADQLKRMNGKLE